MIFHAQSESRSTIHGHSKQISESDASMVKVTFANHSGRAALKRKFWLLEHWKRGFEPHSRQGYMFASFCSVLFCVGRGLSDGVTASKESYEITQEKKFHTKKVRKSGRKLLQTSHGSDRAITLYRHTNTQNPHSSSKLNYSGAKRTRILEHSPCTSY